MICSCHELLLSASALEQQGGYRFYKDSQPARLSAIAATHMPPSPWPVCGPRELEVTETAPKNVHTGKLWSRPNVQHKINHIISGEYRSYYSSVSASSAASRQSLDCSVSRLTPVTRSAQMDSEAVLNV